MPKRLISLLLAFVLMIGTLSPAAAFAQDSEPAQSRGSGREEDPAETAAPEENGTGEDPDSQQPDPADAPETSSDSEDTEYSQRGEPSGENHNTNNTTVNTEQEEPGTYAVMSAAESADSGACGDNVTWRLEGNTLIISGTGPMQDYASYSRPWPYTIEELIVEEGVTSIGVYAFYNTSLVTLSLPSTLSSIGDYAFSLCKQLEEVIIPNAVTIIGKFAFYSCQNLQSVSLPESLTQMGEQAFSECKKLESIEIPYGITTINRVFLNCSSLSSVTIPESVESIGYEAFCYCTSLTEISIPDSVRSIDDRAFLSCSSLEEIKLSNNLRDIGINSFASCVKLDNVILPETLQTIGAGAFNNCKSLSQISVPEGIVDITQAFQRCSNLKKVSLPHTLTNMEAAFYGCSSLTSVNIPENVTNIDFAFENCSALVSVNIPDLVTSIGQNTFKGCSSLQSIVLPDYIDTLGESAFQDCVALTSVRIPPKVTYISYEAFAGCSALTTLYLFPGVSSMGSYAFSGCSALKNVYYGGTQEQWDALMEKLAFQNDILREVDLHVEWKEESENPAPDDPTEPDPAPETKTEVRYFRSWDERERRVYFDLDDTIGVLVTDETDSEFLNDLDSYRGRYVIVETKMEEDQEILLSMNFVLTQTGVVSAATSDSITIAYGTFTLPDGLENPESYIDKNVLYHVYDGWLVGLEILQEKEGYLTYWYAEYNTVFICFDLLSGKEETYTVQDLYTDSDAIDYLGETGKKNHRIKILTDNNRIIYTLEESGFSAIEHGWCFPNRKSGFLNYDSGYKFPDNWYQDVFGPAYVAIGKNYSTMMSTWDGSCSGMSITAMLFYLNQLDWSEYGEDDTKTVNSYYNNIGGEGFDYIPQVRSDDRITELIAKYQILQNGGDVFLNRQLLGKDEDIVSTEECDTNGYFFEEKKGSLDTHLEITGTHNPKGDYISKAYEIIASSSVPLQIDMYWDKGHTVVTRTDKAPDLMEDGWIRVYIYDPNVPYVPDDAISEGEEKFPFRGLASYCLNFKSEDHYIELNPDLNLWRYYGTSLSGYGNTYHGCDKNGEIENCSFSVSYSPNNMASCSYPAYFTITDISALNIPTVFNGKENWLAANENEVNLFTKNNNVVITADGQTIIPIVNGRPVGSEFMDFYYGPTSVTLDGESENAGTLKVPYNEFTIKYLDGEDITLVGKDSVINIASTGPVTLQISMNEGKLEVTAEGDSEVSLQVSDVYDNFTYTCLRADGSLDSGDTVTLQMKNDEFTAEFNGTGSLEVTTKNEAAPEERVIGALNENDQAMDIENVREFPTQEHTHSYASPSFTWTETNACTAVFACSCGESSLSIPCVISSSFTAPTETEDGQVAYTAEVQREEKTYTDTKTIVIPAGSIRLDLPEDFGEMNAAWVDGAAVPVIHDQGVSFLYLPAEDSSILVTHTFHVGDAADIHTQYPLTMQVWKIGREEDGKLTAAHIPELDDILQYSGSSIRITGNKGIRMITSITRDNKTALTSSEGLGGYSLLEYGTALCFARELEGGKSLVLGQEYTRSNYAYKKGVADPVFAYSGNLMQYTNVLVGFTNDQCKEDIAMRPYMILEDAQGNQVTVYGGTVYRSIGYIAWQNRSVFSPGTSAYNFVWDIIHHVYGDKYDADYKK